MDFNFGAVESRQVKPFRLFHPVNERMLQAGAIKQSDEIKMVSGEVTLKILMELSQFAGASSSYNKPLNVSYIAYDESKTIERKNFVTANTTSGSVVVTFNGEMKTAEVVPLNGYFTSIKCKFVDVFLTPNIAGNITTLQGVVTLSEGAPRESEEVIPMDATVDTVSAAPCGSLEAIPIGCTSFKVQRQDPTISDVFTVNQYGPNGVLQQSNIVNEGDTVYRNHFAVLVRCDNASYVGLDPGTANLICKIYK